MENTGNSTPTNSLHLAKKPITAKSKAQGAKGKGASNERGADAKSKAVSAKTGSLEHGGGSWQRSSAVCGRLSVWQQQSAKSRELGAGSKKRTAKGKEVKL